MGVVDLLVTAVGWGLGFIAALFFLLVFIRRFYFPSVTEPSKCTVAFFHPYA